MKRNEQEPYPKLVKFGLVVILFYIIFLINIFRK